MEKTMNAVITANRNVRGNWIMGVPPPPPGGAVQAALRKLEADSWLANRTTLTPTQIVDLLDFVLRSTYFQYDGLIYEQQEGASMSSPVSAVKAEPLHGGVWRTSFDFSDLYALDLETLCGWHLYSWVVTKLTLSYNTSIVKNPRSA